MKFTEIREKYRSKYPASLVAAAVKIAIDMGGAMTPAVKKIEAMKRGLSNDPIVKDALRMANESVEEDLQEAPGKYTKKGDKELYQWGDINKALVAAGAGFRIISNVLTKLSKKEVGIHESVEEAKAPKAKSLSIYGSEISNLKDKKGRFHTVKPLVDKGKLAFRVQDEFGSFKTVDLKTFAKEFG